VPALPRRPPLFRASDAPRRGLGPLRRRHLVLARPPVLRTGAAVRRMARRRTSLFPGDGAALLVAGRAPVSRAAGLAAVAAGPVPAPRRPAEHRAIGAADFLGPHHLPALRVGAAAVERVGTGRPVGGGRADVGAGVGGVPASVGGDRVPLVVRRSAVVLRLSARDNLPRPAALGASGSAESRRAARPPAGPLPPL